MNLLTYVMHLAGSGAFAYYSAAQIRDFKTRPDVLTGFHLAESASVPFLQALSDRAASEGDSWLAEKLLKHAKDEKKHAQIFAHALKQLNTTVVDLKNSSKHTEKNKSKQQRYDLFKIYYQGYSQEQLKPATIEWNTFMASTYILELDASKDFARMATVLPEEEQAVRKLKLGMLNIVKDETGHAAYLYEAMMRRMSTTQVQKLVDQWRIRKVNALMAFTANLFHRK